MNTKFSQAKEYRINGRTEMCCLATFEDGTVWLCKEADKLMPRYVRDATDADIAYFRYNIFPTTANEVRANKG